MSADTYHFTIGDFKCMAISDGSFTYAPPLFPSPPDLLFVNAPKDRLASALLAHGLETSTGEAWTSAYTCLLVENGSRRVLIDTGAGGLGPNTGHLLENLLSAGVEPGQIELVVLTHGHPDHLGGNTDANGDVLFPNADWLMSETEWKFWMEGQADAVLSERSKAVLIGTARRKLEPIRERLRLITCEEEIESGIWVVPAPGHTPGHLAVRVASSGEQLLCISDLALHPLHMEQPDWVAAVDMFPEQLAAQRRALFAAAAATDCLVMAFHFPFPGLGRLSPEGAGWRWKAQDGDQHSPRV
ncbi:MAG: MBL fold metallo-hydrolase [Thermoleophilia bacterium]|nr:MBL fold metallo-hydrolase [Thermoleophilia bacterium]